jgi:hypothetical protein
VNPPEPGVPGTEVKLPAEADAVCVGGASRLVVVSLPKNRQIAIFDVVQARS